jgi:dihydroorotate dehydrogenase (fumarate)
VTQRAKGDLTSRLIVELTNPFLPSVPSSNVRRFALVLARSPSPAVRAVALIGIGGASTPASVRRFLGAGARAVGLATALGKGGVGAFDDLVEGCL